MISPVTRNLCSRGRSHLRPRNLGSRGWHYSTCDKEPICQRMTSLVTGACVPQDDLTYDQESAADDLSCDRSLCTYILEDGLTCEGESVPHRMTSFVTRNLCSRGWPHLWQEPIYQMMTSAVTRSRNSRWWPHLCPRICVPEEDLTCVNRNLPVNDFTWGACVLQGDLTCDQETVSKRLPQLWPWASGFSRGWPWP
jgi:hypothetical protein